MMDEKAIMSEALREIEQRRNRAKAQNIARFEEIERNIPEISEINSQLAKTGMKIISVIREGKNVSERIERLKTENLGAQQMISKLLRSHGYPEDYLKMRYSCNKCEDKGFVDNRRCSCLTRLIAQITAREMNKNSQIKLCSFNTFDLSLCHGIDESSTEQCRKTMSMIFKFCKNYADNFSLSSGNIFMFGKTGLGKTHLSLSIANEVLTKGYNVLYDSVLNYLDSIEKEHFGRDSSGNDTLNRLLSADLLILDDLGTEYDKQFYISTMYTVINTRLNRSLPTIITTNLSHEQMLKKYDDRIISRLYAMYETLEFAGRDVRLTKRQMEKR